MKEEVISLLESRGIFMKDLIDILFDLQVSYIPTLTREICENSLQGVLAKREVQNVILTGLALDMLAEKQLLPTALNDMLVHDAPLYGVDENLGFAISGIYGTIGNTGYGYLDKEKPGLIGRLNDQKDQVNTFADDIVGAIVAAAAARMAHRLMEEDRLS